MQTKNGGLGSSNQIQATSCLNLFQKCSLNFLSCKHARQGRTGSFTFLPRKFYPPTRKSESNSFSSTAVVLSTRLQLLWFDVCLRRVFFLPGTVCALLAAFMRHALHRCLNRSVHVCVLFVRVPTQVSHLKAACEDLTERTLSLISDETCRAIALPPRLPTACWANVLRHYPYNAARYIRPYAAFLSICTLDCE